jgi:undecaprenyl pyrophosphate phosphatase UppP
MHNIIAMEYCQHASSSHGHLIIMQAWIHCNQQSSKEIYVKQLASI